MIIAFADASLDEPILSVGYVLYRAENGDETLLDTGTRVVNTDEEPRNIPWCSSRAEYYGAIIATRAALEHTCEPLMLHLDNNVIVRAIKKRDSPFEEYFDHCIHSFLPRFSEYHVRSVHRDKNEAAHEQARVGLKIGRDIQKGVL